jgi:hypothetical protein
MKRPSYFQRLLPTTGEPAGLRLPRATFAAPVEITPVRRAASSAIPRRDETPVAGTVAEPVRAVRWERHAPGPTAPEARPSANTPPLVPAATGREPAATALPARAVPVAPAIRPEAVEGPPQPPDAAAVATPNRALTPIHPELTPRAAPVPRASLQPQVTPGPPAPPASARTGLPLPAIAVPSDRRALERAAAAAAQSPRIDIGSIEVRLTPAPAAPRNAARRPSGTLLRSPAAVYGFRQS